MFRKANFTAEDAENAERSTSALSASSAVRDFVFLTVSSQQ
jgi:hypothetical protein